MATLSLDQQRAIAIADAKRKQAQAAGQQEPYSGQILPFSKDAQGNVSFDPNAGLFGSINRLMHEDPTSDAGIADAAQTAMLVSPVGAAARGGLGWAGVKPTPRTKAVTPTAEDLKGAAGFGYDLVRQMGVDYDARAVQNLMLQTRSRLFNDGVIEELAPKSFAILKKLESPPEGGVATIAGLDAARRQLGQAAQDFTNPTEQMAATRIIRSLDRFIENPDAKAVVAGPAAAAGGVWKDAKGNYAAAKRSERITGREADAEIQAAVTNSGKNIDNRIRSVAAAILKSDKLSSGYSPEELTMLKEVAEGTATRNRIRDVGNLLGGGGGLGAFVTGSVGGAAGGAMGGLAGVAVGAGLPVIGLGAKVLGNRMTKRALGRVDDTVRQRSPLYRQRVEDAPVTKPAPDVRGIMPRAAAGATMPQMTPEQWNEYLKRKYALQQGA